MHAYWLGYCVRLLVLLAVLTGAHARAEIRFEGEFPESVPLAPGASVVLHLYIRNTGAEAAEAVLRMNFLQLLGNLFSVTAESDCAVPPGFFAPPMFLLLQPAELRTCSYRVTRSASGGSDERLVFSLQGSSAPLVARTREVALGDLATLRSSFTPIGPPRRVGDSWRQSGRWTVENLGPTDLSVVDYGTCLHGMPPLAVLETGSECGKTQRALCFGGQIAIGLGTGPLAAGETLHCTLELVATNLPSALSLPLLEARKSVGGTAVVIGDRSLRLELRDNPLAPPQPVPASSYWSLLSLALFVALLGMARTRRVGRASLGPAQE